MNWCRWRTRHLDLISALLRETIEQLAAGGHTTGTETLLRAVVVLVAIVRGAEAQALDWAETAREEEGAFPAVARGAPESPRLHQADGAVHEGAGRPQEEGAPARVRQVPDR